MNLKERAGLIDTVGSALARGEHTLTVLPNLIRQLLEEGAWREFETKMGKHVTYDRFEDFAVTPPLAGLGASIDLIERLVKDDTETYSLLREAIRRPVGNPNFSNHQQSTIIDIVNNSEPKSPNGNSKAYALQKLSDEGQTELLEQVKSGKMSANAAMQKAGFRRRRIAVYLDDPTSAAKTLLSHASPEFLDELRRLLLGGEE